MSLDREIKRCSAPREVEDIGIDPFVVVAGIIVAILISSLLLWLNGGAEINGGGQQYSTEMGEEIVLVG